MNPNAQFERDLEEWLEAAAGASAPEGFHVTVMDRARTLRQRPAWTTTATARRFGRGRVRMVPSSPRDAVVGVLAVGAVMYLVRPAASTVGSGPAAKLPGPADLDHERAWP
jgi:hypothetical protein